MPAPPEATAAAELAATDGAAAALDATTAGALDAGADAALDAGAADAGAAVLDAGLAAPPQAARMPLAAARAAAPLANLRKFRRLRLGGRASDEGESLGTSIVDSLLHRCRERRHPWLSKAHDVPALVSMLSAQRRRGIGSSSESSCVTLCR